MRLEITYSHPTVIAAVYATDGRLLARGYGLDEESARLDAAREMVSTGCGFGIDGAPCYACEIKERATKAVRS